MSPLARRTAAIALGLALALGGCGSDDEPGSDGTGGAAGSGGAGGSAGATSGGGAGVDGSAGTGGTSGSGATAGAGGSGASGGAGGNAGTDGGGDGDGDGLDDANELAIAQSHFPYYSIAADDQCPLHGVLFRATPHPDDATKIMVWYVVLFQNDCGANGHVGDDEVFGAVIDPTQPAPAGILALRAISHQGTLCEKITTCGSLPACSACATAPKGGQSFPLVFPSVNKHGQYVDEGTCDLNLICDFGGCTLNPTPDAPSFVNAGEPGKPLVNDLSTSGFITPGNGWTEQGLMGFDPWGGQDFGSAGNVTDDLQDAAFVVPLSGC